MWTNPAVWVVLALIVIFLLVGYLELAERRAAAHAKRWDDWHEDDESQSDMASAKAVAEGGPFRFGGEGDGFAGTSHNGAGFATEGNAWEGTVANALKEPITDEQILAGYAAESESALWNAFEQRAFVKGVEWLLKQRCSVPRLSVGIDPGSPDGDKTEVHATGCLSKEQAMGNAWVKQATGRAPVTAEVQVTFNCDTCCGDGTVNTLNHLNVEEEMDCPDCDGSGEVTRP